MKHPISKSLEGIKGLEFETFENRPAPIESPKHRKA